MTPSEEAEVPVVQVAALQVERLQREGNVLQEVLQLEEKLNIFLSRHWYNLQIFLVNDPTGYKAAN